MHGVNDTEKLNQHRDEMQRHLRRNFLANGVEGGVYIGGVAFVQPDSVLPKMLESVGAYDLLIAMSPVLMFLGFMMPQIFMVQHIERLKRMKPLVMVCGLFQRLPYLLIGLTLFFFPQSLPSTVQSILVAFVPFFSGLFGGISIAAWQEFIAKTIPPERRTSLWAMRNIISALMGFGAGIAVKNVLEVYPGLRGWGLLHLIAWSCLMLSWLIFALTRETTLPPKHSDTRKGWLTFVRDMPAILRDDRRLVNLLLSRFFGAAVFMIIPFLSIRAIQVLQVSDAFVGELLICQMLGIITGNLIGAVVGDRMGGKAVAISGTSGFVLLALTAMVAGREWHFFSVFFIFGLVLSMQKTGIMTLSLEVAPIRKRVSYLTIQGVLGMPGIVFAPILASYIRTRTEHFYWLAIPSAIGSLLALFFLLRVMEPRNDAETA